MPEAGSEQWLIEVDDARAGSRVVGYLERRRAQIAELRDALNAADFETLWMAGHRMHGAGGAYGVPRISELGAALEVRAFERDVPGLLAEIARLEAFLARVAVIDRQPTSAAAEATRVRGGKEGDEPTCA